ncbi:hypothetical protein DENSPDRAFT_885914 [Dentipellis sp. KUC8613]|nr:hypothetical protein DENSPDRAFT_885914 [Dentipellis sp. KUC8613]
MPHSAVPPAPSAAPLPRSPVPPVRRLYATVPRPRVAALSRASRALRHPSPTLSYPLLPSPAPQRRTTCVPHPDAAVPRAAFSAPYAAISRRRAWVSLSRTSVALPWRVPAALSRRTPSEGRRHAPRAAITPPRATVTRFRTAVTRPRTLVLRPCTAVSHPFSALPHSPCSPPRYSHIVEPPWHVVSRRTPPPRTPVPPCRRHASQRRCLAPLPRRPAPPSRCNVSKCRRCATGGLHTLSPALAMLPGVLVPPSPSFALAALAHHLPGASPAIFALPVPPRTLHAPLCDFQSTLRCPPPPSTRPPPSSQCRQHIVRALFGPYALSPCPLLPSTALHCPPPSSTTLRRPPPPSTTLHHPPPPTAALHVPTAALHTPTAALHAPAAALHAPYAPASGLCAVSTHRPPLRALRMPHVALQRRPRCPAALRCPVCAFDMPFTPAAALSTAVRRPRALHRPVCRPLPSNRPPTALRRAVHSPPPPFPSPSGPCPPPSIVHAPSAPSTTLRNPVHCPLPSCLPLAARSIRRQRPQPVACATRRLSMLYVRHLRARSTCYICPLPPSPRPLQVRRHDEGARAHTGQ